MREIGRQASGLRTIPNSVENEAESALSPIDETGSQLALPNLLYSIRETRTLLGVSHATTYRLIAAGKLDARKILGQTVITGRSIGKFVSELPSVGEP